jgi:CubicO group peptidase (beta-lactamase class C family)
MSDRFVAAQEILRRAVAERAFPAATIEVGTATEPIWREAFGTLTYDQDSAAAREDTVFDLASLTKVLATTSLVMQQVERGGIDLDDRVATLFPRWRGTDRETVSLRDLLAHCSGLPAHRPYFRSLRGREQFELAICSEPLEYAPRSRSIYSDLGFMLLGFALERGSSLPERFAALKSQMRNVQDLQFHPPPIWLPRTAPTQFDDWRGRLLRGEVDDQNTYALGGAAGQSGLFGTAGAVGEYARHLLQVLDGRTGAFSRSTALLFTRRQDDVPGSSRALGWDTMLPTSSCGTRMSRRAFGHTGFTGTSLWIDPDRMLYVVLLTNRVFPKADNPAIQRVRPALHDAVIDAWDRQV